MNKFKLWLSVQDHHEALSLKSLIIVLNETESRAVAIKASNVAPVTYQMIATVCQPITDYCYH